VAQTEPSKCIVTVVDDRSTEDIKSIVKEFKPMLKIQYITTLANTGSPGLARQTGINATNCPYIMFLDADDMLTNFAIELANREMRYTNADVLIGYFYTQNKNTFDLYDEGATTWLHGNVYKRSFLNDKNIKFFKGVNEDGAFNTQCFLLADKIGYIKEPMSFWLENPGSLTRTEDKNNLKFATDLSDNLKYAYLNILEQKQEDIIYENLGKHLYLFFKKWIEMNDDDAKNFLSHLNRFTRDLRLNDLKEEKRTSIKKGFLKKYLKEGMSQCELFSTFFNGIDFWTVSFFFWDIDLLGGAQ
jgi:hypothetical protein